MTLMRLSTPTTVEEFLARPLPERGISELIGGEVVVNDPDFRHQRLVTGLAAEIEMWCRAAPERGVPVINIDTRVGGDILQPDIQWYAHGRVMNDPTTRPQPLADLVVEVRSPSTWSRDVGAKRSAYERHGAQELWLVDPLSQTVMVFRRSTPDTRVFDVALDLDADAALTSPLLPGFAVPLARLFG